MKIPKLAKGGVIKIPVISSKSTEDLFGMFMSQQEMILKIKHQKKVIDRLSRKIQRKNQEYRKLKAKKMPPTLYGSKVIVVPESIANEIMIINEKFFDPYLGEK